MDPQVNPQVPPIPVHIPKKGFNLWMIATFVLLAALLAGGAYYFGKMQGNGNPNMPIYTSPTPSSPPAAVSPTTIPSPTGPSANAGTVTGTLCYPASGIPAGTITAKSTTTNKEFTQSYPGTANGGGTTYSLSLAPDVYHMKFTPTQYATVIGYYTDYSTCVGNPGPNCSGQKTRPLLPVTVTTGATISAVNLCDYYYPPDNPPQF